MKRHEIIGSQLVKLGGPGSGNWGHKGVPGQRGGFAPGGGGTVEEMAMVVERLPAMFNTLRHEGKLNRRTSTLLNSIDIGWPESAEEIEETLRKVLGKLRTMQLERTLNRGAAKVVDYIMGRIEEVL